MITRVYSVFDAKAEAYLPPMFFQSKGIAVRAFSAAIADPKHDFARYSEDFVLFELGSFDDSNATFMLHASPMPIGRASEFVSRTPLEVAIDERG